LGLLADHQQRWDEAARCYEEALAIRREVNDRRGEGVTLTNLGGVAERQGRLEEAVHHYRAALSIAREVGDRVGEGHTLNKLCAVEDARRNGEEAERYCREALAIYTELGLDKDRQEVMTVLARLTPTRPSSPRDGTNNG
jgi:tetratricopeptide (TPR) repeat protein